MQRWHLTVGLTGLAIGAALVAPRLTAMLQGPAPLPPPDVPTPPLHVPPVADVGLPDSVGNLTVDAGLDHGAILSGKPTERFLTINVGAPTDIGEQFRRPVDLSVVIDASGSMSARGKIDYAKRAAKLLATNMEPEDTYSLIVFNDDAATVVPATRATDVGAIHRAIDRIYEGGGTNLYAGMDRGAREVRESMSRDAIGRVVVLSDGNANVGVTDPSALSRFAADLSSEGVALSTIGLGLDYNEDLLASLADMGGGTYDFVDDPRELEGVFSDELARTASVVARSTSVEIELPDGVEPVEVIGWDAVRTPNGWRVFLGDVYSGENRKIVTRVRIIGDDIGERPVASVVADYQDLVDGIAGRTWAAASTQVTDDPSTVRASIDAARAAEANEALGGWYLEMSTRAYADGDHARTRSLINKGRDVMRAAAVHNPELQQAAEELDEAERVFEMHAPMSTEGKRAIKANKEMFRERSR